MADTKISALTALSAVPDVADLLAIVDVSDTTQAASGTTKKITAANLLVGAKLGQVVYSIDGAVATGSTTTPWDDTIPQNTEGTEFYSVSITPKNASSVLLIWPFIEVACTSGTNIVMAVHVDSTANALYFKSMLASAANYGFPMGGPFVVSAGSTSARTYKLRVGPAGGTITINGASSARKGGGVAASGIIVAEILP